VIAHVGSFVTRICGTTDGVGAVRRYTGLTIVYGATGLGTVAEKTIVAQRVARRMIAAIGSLVARIRRATDGIRAIRRGPRLTTERHVADFRAVTEEAVAAYSIVADMVAAIGCLVAGIDRAADTVTAIRRCAGLTVVYGIADLRPVTV